MSLAIATPEPDVYSETFIQKQFESLPWQLRLHGNPIGSSTEPEGPLLPDNREAGWRRFPTISLLALERLGLLSAHQIALRARLRKYGIKCVLANYGPTAVQLAGVCNCMGIKLCVHFHGFDASKQSTLEEYGAEYRRLLPGMHSIIAVSQDMHRRLLQLGAPADKIRILRYGVDTEVFRPPTEQPVDSKICFAVGRFVDKKAPLLTLLAFKRVTIDMPDARLVMGGEGDLLEATRGAAAALDIADKVEFPGILSRMEVLRWMQRAAIFVQHSMVPSFGPYAGDAEGTPVALLEAMACGLPVVSTRHGGIPDAVEHGIEGLLVEEGDVRGMAAAMASLLASPVKRVAMGQQARRKIIEQYNVESYLDALRGLLRG